MRDGLPQRRITYLRPKLHRSPSSMTVVHVNPSFRSAATRTDHTRGYVPSLESTIMNLEVLFSILSVILVSFSRRALRSETHIKVPWSEWGLQHARCFPYHPSHRFSVSGSKMAYALPRYRTPEIGQRRHR
ncbi:hypothetical protein BDR03DRAFT_158354 [Suillus americanus]|nr:hypothetical protein BDR03DRAFT_158354 [Suillus americanus]